MANKVPLGKPLDLTDKELDALAQVTKEDISKARKFWKKHAPEEFKELLDAPLVVITEE